MYSLHSANLPPYEAELSRQAAERHALLTAAKEHRRSQRPASRRRRLLTAQPRPFAVDVAPVSPRC